MSTLYLILTLLIFPLFVVANETDKCGNNEEARTLVSLIKNDKEQKRTYIRCNKILTEVAEAKAKKMSESDIEQTVSNNFHLTVVQWKQTLTFKV